MKGKKKGGTGLRLAARYRLKDLFDGAELRCGECGSV